MRGRRSSRYAVIALSAILAAGLLLRLRAIDAPPIGYHSMKEVHYLSIARAYLDHGDLAHKRVLYSGLDEGPGYIEGMPQFQFLPLIYYGIWRLAGVRLWAARLVVVLFSLGCVLLLHRVARRLTGDPAVPLIAAALAAVLPVSVFFGRNIQPDTVALFFALLSTLFFLRWRERLRWGDLLAFSLAAAATAAVKGTFVASVLPVLIMFPLDALRRPGTRRRLAVQAAWLLPGAALFLAWLLFTRIEQSGDSSLLPAGRLVLREAFTAPYWRRQLPLLWRYAGENYTYPLFFVFLLGCVRSLLEPGRALSRYIAASLLALVAYFVLLSDFAVRHSYYHLPWLPLFCLASAAAVAEGMRVVGARGGGMSRARLILPAILLLAVVPQLRMRIDWHFDRQMIGCVAAGRYIAEHADPEDRVFISYGSPSDRRFDAWRTQYYGVLWEAQRRGSLLPADLERVRFGERECGMRWIVVFRFEWLERDRALLEHIRSRYSIRQAGYADGTLLYYVLERGGAFDPSVLDGIEPRPAASYRIEGRPIEITVRDVPPRSS